jgi:hypothetical protein
VQPSAVVGQGDQQPFEGDLLSTAQAEAGEADTMLNNAEGRLDGLSAFLVAGSTFFAFFANRQGSRMRRPGFGSGGGRKL